MIAPIQALPPGTQAATLFQVIEAVPTGVVLTDSRGIMLLVNAELERMFGYERSRLLEQSVEMLVPERFRKEHTALRAGYWHSPSQRAMGAGRELFGLRADGTEIPIEIGLNAVQTERGLVGIASVVDITGRKRLERTFQRAVEAAPCGMLMVDSSAKIILANAQADAMFGYEAGELLGRPIETILPERARAAHVHHRTQFLASPSMRQMGAGRDLTALRKDGSEFPIEIGLNPVSIESGNAVLATVTDITHRKRMELELSQANLDLEEFTYVASHDLKSPLRGISDLTDWIRDDLGEQASAAVTHNLDRIVSRIRRLENVIDELLTYAKAGRDAAQQVMVDPLQLLNSIFEMQPAPPKFKVTIDSSAESFVTARTPLETVLRNLLSNAIKHHDCEAGRIEIKVDHDGRYCRFVVKDDGPGIPKAAQQRVFRMFQTSSARDKSGTGIGLALAKRLTEAHGGRITVDSRDGERGTAFTVLWPRFYWSGGNA
jgi:PAS domain S-box-containing protein